MVIMHHSWPTWSSSIDLKMSATSLFQFFANVHAKSTWFPWSITIEDTEAIQTKLLNSRMISWVRWSYYHPPWSMLWLLWSQTPNHHPRGIITKTATSHFEFEVSELDQPCYKHPHKDNGLGTERMNQSSVLVAATNPTSPVPEVNEPKPMSFKFWGGQCECCGACLSFCCSRVFSKDKGAGDDEDNNAALQIIATDSSIERVRAAIDDPSTIIEWQCTTCAEY